MSRTSCNVCGGHDAHPVSVDERAAWPWLASWITVICSDCRRRFRRSEERYAEKTAA